MLLHSDFQNGSPQLFLFHRTSRTAGVGAATMWKDPDFGTRSYSTRIQGSTPKDKNYWRDLLRQGLVPLCFCQQKRATDLISYTLQWNTTEVCFLWTLRAANWYRKGAGVLQARRCSLEWRSFWPVTQKQQQEQILKTLNPSCTSSWDVEARHMAMPSG